MQNISKHHLQGHQRPPETQKNKDRQTEIHLLLVEQNKGRNIHSLLSNLICMKEIVKWVLSFSSSVVAKVISRTQEYYLAIEHSMKRRRSECRGEDEEYNGRNVKAGPVTISLSREEPDQQQQINILALQRNLSPPLHIYKGINTLEDKHLLSLLYL